MTADEDTLADPYSSCQSQRVECWLELTDWTRVPPEALGGRGEVDVHVNAIFDDAVERLVAVRRGRGRGRQAQRRDHGGRVDGMWR